MGSKPMIEKYKVSSGLACMVKDPSRSVMVPLWVPSTWMLTPTRGFPLVSVTVPVMVDWGGGAIAASKVSDGHRASSMLMIRNMENLFAFIRIIFIILSRLILTVSVN